MGIYTNFDTGCLVARVGFDSVGIPATCTLDLLSGGSVVGVVSTGFNLAMIETKLPLVWPELMAFLPWLDNPYFVPPEGDARQKAQPLA